jgi:hypothetical protein
MERGESSMKMRWAWTLPVLSSLAMMLAASSLRAQGPYGPAPSYGQGPMGGSMAMYAPPGAMPAMGPGSMGPAGMPGGMMPGMPGGPPGATNISYMQPPPDAYGMYGEAPPDMMMQGGMPMDEGRPHGLCNGLLGDVFGLVAPYPDGGCSAVRWFDVAMDAMYLERDNRTADIVLATFGQGGVNGIALRTGQLEFDSEISFRFTGQTQIGPASSLEFTYYGLFYYDDEAVATRLGPLATDGLYSVLSDFGTDPPGGFAETDNADLQSVRYESDFDNFELNFRQRWMAPNCRYQGSWLWGARFFKLEEQLLYFSQSTVGLLPGDPARTMDYTVDVNNSLTGLQIGGDMWVCLLPGLRAGVEAKGAVCYNKMNVDSVIQVNTQPINPPLNPFVEENIGTDISFVADANAQVTYRVNYNWTARVGYQVLFVEGVALAPNNFNTEPPSPPFGPGPNTRVPFLDDDGSIFYHGFNAGLEYMW